MSTTTVQTVPLASDLVKESLAYIEAIRDGGQTVAADLLGSTITTLTQSNLTAYMNGRKDALRAVRSAVEGLTSAGTAGFQMQSAVLRALDRMEGQ
jgi:hypothetical protein